MTRKAKSKTKKQKELADKLWSLAVRKVGYCEKCGNVDTLQAHHLIRRTNYRFRWAIDNGVCLCAGCHQFNDESAHAGNDTTSKFLSWLKKEKPEQYLWFEANRDDKRTYKPDYEAIIAELNDQLVTF
jgi:5-methylcytosine-specific restriction endonuclease McrA